MTQTPRATRLGSLTLQAGLPRLAVSLNDRVSGAELRRVRQAADLAEWRVDLFSSLEKARALSALQRLKGFPTLVTIRSRKEGGRWTGSEAARLELFRYLLPAAQAVDIELSSKAILSSVIAEAHCAKKKTIVSFHDFHRMPPPAKLAAVLKKARAAGADIVKIAAHASSERDFQALAKFTFDHSSTPLITIAMGKEGSASRLLFPALGSLITYSFIGKPTAPGQFNLFKMRRLLRTLYPKM